jgi:hypothetical protein
VVGEKFTQNSKTFDLTSSDLSKAKLRVKILLIYTPKFLNFYNCRTSEKIEKIDSDNKLLYGKNKCGNIVAYANTSAHR